MKRVGLAFIWLTCLAYKASCIGTLIPRLRLRFVDSTTYAQPDVNSLRRKIHFGIEIEKSVEVAD